MIGLGDAEIRIGYLYLRRRGDTPLLTKWAYEARPALQQKAPNMIS